MVLSVLTGSFLSFASAVFLTLYFFDIFSTKTRNERKSPNMPPDRFADSVNAPAPVQSDIAVLTNEIELGKGKVTVRVRVTHYRDGNVTAVEERPVPGTTVPHYIGLAVASLVFQKVFCSVWGYARVFLTAYLLYYFWHNVLLVHLHHAAWRNSYEDVYVDWVQASLRSTFGVLSWVQVGFDQWSRVLLLGGQPT